MGKAIDISGQRFGRLLAIEPTEKRVDAKVVWRFLCECGEHLDAIGKNVRSGSTQSCGCLQSDRTKAYCAAKRTDKKCPECGISFQVKQSHALKTTYCSRTCMSRAYTDRMIGAGNPNYRNIPLEVKVAAARARSRDYRSSHKEEVAAANRNSKARRKKADGSHTQNDIESLRLRQDGQCAACRDGLHGSGHVDHIIPLARGGTNFVGNIQLLCASCNLSKKALLPIEFKWNVLSGVNEEAEQSRVMAWAHQDGAKFPAVRMLHHAANGGHRTKRTAARMQAVGVKKGVPDLSLPAPRHGFHGLFIEMKVGRNKPTPEQLAWHSALREQGFRVDVCYGAAAAIAVLKEYLS